MPENPNYRIEVRDGCVLVHNSFPVDVFKQITKLAPKKAVMSPHVARLAGAVIAAGLQEDLDALERKLSAEIIENYERSTGEPLSDPGKRWLLTGEHGMSSAAIFYHTMEHYPGLTTGADFTAHPHDPCDLRRCRILLETVPEVAERFSRMEAVSPVWGALYGGWAQLCETMDRECPEWRDKVGKASDTWQMMQDLIAQASTRPTP